MADFSKPYVKLLGNSRKDVYRHFNDEDDIYETSIIMDFSKMKIDEHFEINTIYKCTQYELFREINNYLFKKIPRDIKCRVPDIYATNDKNLCIEVEDCGPVHLYKTSYNFTIYKNLIRWLAHLDTLYKKRDVSYFIKNRTYEVEAMQDEMFDFVMYYEILDVSDLVEDTLTGIQNIPLTICHRNFEQKNILVVDQETKILNVQNMCLGPVGYDIACLLYDPVNELDEKEIDTLIKLYAMLINQDYRYIQKWVSLCRKLRFMTLVGKNYKLYSESGKHEYKIKGRRAAAALDKSL